MKKNRRNRYVLEAETHKICLTSVTFFVLLAITMAWVCVTIGSAQSSTEEQQQRRREASEALRQRAETRQERSSANETGNAGLEDMRQQFRDRVSTMRQRSFDRLQEVVHVTDQEWSIVRPRLQKVFYLVRPPMSFENRQEPKTDVDLQRQELIKLLQDEKTDAGKIKTQLTALRTALERARQERIQAQNELRQVLSLRQEAQLVVEGLLN